MLLWHYWTRPSTWPLEQLSQAQWNQIHSSFIYLQVFLTFRNYFKIAAEINLYNLSFQK
jgi:hypothetical protein